MLYFFKSCMCAVRAIFSGLTNLKLLKHLDLSATNAAVHIKVEKRKFSSVKRSQGQYEDIANQTFVKRFFLLTYLFLQPLV